MHGFNHEEIVKELRNKAKKRKQAEELLSMDIQSVADYKLQLAVGSLYIPSQSRGKVFENKIKQYFNFNSAPTKTSGDLEKYKLNVEVKISLEGKEEKMSALQIRPDHNVDFYLFQYYSHTTDILHTMMIPSKEVYKLIGLYGGYTHGTIEKQGIITDISLNENYGKGYEYSLHATANKPHTKSGRLWADLTKYSIDMDNIDLFLNNI